MNKTKKKINNVIIIGLGAIGSIYATKIFDCNPDLVKVLVDESRGVRYKKNKIIFNGKEYDFEYVLNTETDFKADLILIATKAKDFPRATEMIKNFVGEDTIILSLLNGISSEPVLVNKFEKDKILYSYYIGHASVKNGFKIDYDGIGKIVFGEEDNQNLSENVKRVKDFFDTVGVDYEIPEDMTSSMWQKFVINIGINQTSAIYRADYGLLQTSAEAQKTARELMEEAVEIAKALKVKNADKFIDETFNLINDMPPELKSSMLQDVENNRVTEVDIFAGEICRLGKKLNIATPKNEKVIKMFVV